MNVTITVNATNVDFAGGSVLRSILGLPGPRGAGIIWQRAYDNDTAYVVGDAVYYPTTGGSYINIQAGTGNLPTDTDFWDVIATIGDELTDKNLTNYSETVETDTDSGAAHTIDLSDGNVHTLTLTAECTLTFSNPPDSGKAGSFTLVLTQDGSGGHSVVWPDTVLWAGGAAPELSTDADAVDVLTFFTTDAGTSWYGFLSGRDMQ